MKKGISSNFLKIIAIIIMIIDHIASYFYYAFDTDVYYIFRTIGRMAMPIFAYLIVQGFFYTKNLKKYILRIFIFATITQICLFIVGFINYLYYPNYWSGVNNYLGILYSYFLSLILIVFIDKKIIIDKLNENQNLLIRISGIILILIIYLMWNIEYNTVIPFIIVVLYGIEKFFIKDNVLLLKQPKENRLGYKIIYVFLIFLCLYIATFLVGYSAGYKYAMISSVIFIALYNGEQGKKNKFLQYVFYAIFPLQHTLLYLLAMMV